MTTRPSSLSVSRPWSGVPAASVDWPNATTRNAMDGATALDMAAMLGCRLDPDLRVVVLGAGQAPYCSGWNVNDLADVDVNNPGAVRKFFTPGRELLSTMANCRLILISVVRGPALGFACSLLARSDLVLAADDAEFGLPEIKRGFPAATVIPELLEVLPPREVRAWAVSGSRFDARRAAQVGLVHEVMPQVDLAARLAELVHELAQIDPVAVQDTKRLIGDIARLPLEDSRRAGVALATHHLRGRDHQNSVPQRQGLPRQQLLKGREVT